MTAAYLLPTVHLAINSTAVWAFFVALSLITVQCILLARSNRQSQPLRVRRPGRPFPLPQRHPH